MRLIRWLHKWFGLVLGLQLLLWALSGAVMTVMDPAQVSGETAVHAAAEPPGPPANLVPLGQAQAVVGAPILRLELKPLYGDYVYVATTPAGVRLVDAAEGTPVVIDAAKARAIATDRYAGYADVASVTRVGRPTVETRDADLPVWRVAFADQAHTTLLVSATTGDLEGVRTDAWRIRDIAWMLHIMDYGKRESFNHPLIVTVGTAALWIALSGLILLFRSFRRSDVAWLLDRFEPRQAASKDAT